MRAVLIAAILLVACSAALATSSQNQIIRTAPDGSQIIIDYLRLTITVGGVESPMIIDYPDCPDGTSCVDSAELRQTIIDNLINRGSRSEVFIEYDRFDVYIDSAYYANNTPLIDEFFDLFEPRYEYMESVTGWSSELNDGGVLAGQKLEIHVSSTTGCYGGGGYPGYVNLLFSDPLYMEGCALGGGTGELGDWWPYMGVALHETIHATNPWPVFSRWWLTEGWARYHEYNGLVAFGDISQETADHDIYDGDSGYNWEGYVANDYHDTSPSNKEIQNSRGYSITAWMFCMLRDDYDLSWPDFYALMSDNLETLQESWVLGGSDYHSRHTDIHIIDLFSRACGLSFDSIQAIFEYDGPEGPGWGVRDWVDLDWYADLTASINFSNDHPVPNYTVQVTAVIHNLGDVDVGQYIDSTSTWRCIGAVTRVYEGETLLAEDTLLVPNHDSASMVVEFLPTDTGSYEITVIVDEDNLKIELDDDNNSASAMLVVESDTDSDGVADAVDNCPTVYNPDQFDIDLDGVGTLCDNCPEYPNNDQANDDADSLGNVCDNCQVIDNDDQADGDGDDVGDVCDNCIAAENADQTDIDGNCFGDACDCCENRGDINHDGLPQPDIADLVHLVTFMFQDGPAPMCSIPYLTECPDFYYAEADINGDGTCAPDIADLVYLVTYMFQDGPPLIPCDTPGPWCE